MTSLAKYTESDVIVTVVFLCVCQDYGARLGQVISERSAQVQEMRRQLLSREQELNEVNRERERDAAVPAVRELQTLKSLVKEKDAFIQVMELVQVTSSQSQTCFQICTFRLDYIRIVSIVMCDSAVPDWQNVFICSLQL